VSERGVAFCVYIPENLYNKKSNKAKNKKQKTKKQKKTKKNILVLNQPTAYEFCG
jgi:hypothetical protein